MLYMYNGIAKKDTDWIGMLLGFTIYTSQNKSSTKLPHNHKTHV